MDFAYNYSYEYDYPSSYYYHDDPVLDVIVPIYLLVLTIAILFALVSYAVSSVALYTIGKRMGKEHPWLAFIPFARDYFHGELAGVIALKSKRIRRPGIWKLVLPIVYAAVTGIFAVIMILAVSIMIAVGRVGGVISGVMILIVLCIALTLISIIYMAGYTVLQIMVDIQIFERFTTRNMAIVHAVLSSVVPLYEAICLFVMRNKPFNPGMEPCIASASPVSPVPPVSPVHPAAEPAEETPVQAPAEPPLREAEPSAETTAQTTEENES